MSRRKPKGNRPPSVPFFLTFWAETQEWAPAEQVVAFYLATCPERETSREGLFVMTPGRVACGLASRWDEQRVVVAFDGLERRRWLIRDGGWIFIPSAMQHDQPWGPKQVAAAIARVADAPRDSLVWLAFIEVAHLRAPDLAAALSDLPLSVPNRYPSDTQKSSVGAGYSMGIGSVSDTHPRLEGTPGRTPNTTDPDDGGQVAA